MLHKIIRLKKIVFMLMKPSVIFCPVPYKEEQKITVGEKGFALLKANV